MNLLLYWDRGKRKSNNKEKHLHILYNYLNWFGEQKYYSHGKKQVWEFYI